MRGPSARCCRPRQPAAGRALQRADHPPPAAAAATRPMAPRPCPTPSPGPRHPGRRARGRPPELLLREGASLEALAEVRRSLALPANRARRPRHLRGRCPRPIPAPTATPPRSSPTWARSRPHPAHDRAAGRRRPPRNPGRRADHPHDQRAPHPGRAPGRQRHPHRTLRANSVVRFPPRRRAGRCGPAPPRLHAAMASRIKIMASLDIAESACRRMAASPCAWPAGRWLCAYPPCPPPTASASCCACSTRAAASAASTAWAWPPPPSAVCPPARPPRHPPRHRPHRLGKSTTSTPRCRAWTPRAATSSPSKTGRIRPPRRRPDPGQPRSSSASPGPCGPSSAKTRTSS